MKVLHGIVKWMAPVAMFAAMSGVASAQVDPSQVSIVGTPTFNGSGCPLGTTSTNLSADRQAFTVVFSDYIAELFPGSSPSDRTKNCQVTLTLRIPQGFQYSLASFDYRGFADLDKFVEARQTATYYFQGQGDQGTFNTAFNGPMSGDYSFRDTIGLASAIWSPCGVNRALNINTRLILRNSNTRRAPNAQGLITTDSLDGSIKHVYGLQWRRC